MVLRPRKLESVMGPSGAQLESLRAESLFKPSRPHTRPTPALVGAVFFFLNFSLQFYLLYNTYYGIFTPDRDH